MALGAYNQRRLVPRLKELAATGQTPGRAGFALRRSIRAEILLIVGRPGRDRRADHVRARRTMRPAGPVSKTASLGPADVQLTVDPARVGPNEMHVYLIDKQNGTQYDKVKEMNVDLLLPAEKLGPLKADVRKAGPGHYVMNGALFGVSGEWDVKMSARVSEFDAYYASRQGEHRVRARICVALLAVAAAGRGGGSRRGSARRTRAGGSRPGTTSSRSSTSRA